MNAVTVSTTTSIRPRTSESGQLRQIRLGWTEILGFSAVLGCLCVILGWVLSIEAVVGIAGRRWSSIGAVFIALFFPLMLIAAHCMDRAQAASRAIRLDYYRKYG